MFSVAPSLATNASAAFNPYLGPVSPSLVPAEILPTAPMLVTGNPGVPVPAAAAAAAQKLMRTDRLEVGMMSRFLYVLHSDFHSVLFVSLMAVKVKKIQSRDFGLVCGASY